jgi:hypothetical protein
MKSLEIQLMIMITRGDNVVWMPASGTPRQVRAARAVWALPSFMYLPVCDSLVLWHLNAVRLLISKLDPLRARIVLRYADECFDLVSLLTVQPT